jgi:DNA-binding CsgD family transcriptional regulator
MMNSSHLSNAYLRNPTDVLFSVLENTEVGLVVVDASGRAVYMNSSARGVLESPMGALPDWAAERIEPILEQLQRSSQAVERWVQGDLVLRVRARPLDRGSQLTVMEITVAHAAGGRQIAEQLARSLRLTITDARLLALLWRGMSNDEIAQLLGVRVGTVKSRLFRLYQKLGVKRRPAAVLRAAEVLAA